MEQRRLGRIGHMSSVLIYGGAALGDVSQEVADTSIQQALDAGINHFDTAAGYGDSELRLGEWMPRIRDRIFLASKTGDRERRLRTTRSGAPSIGCRSSASTCSSSTRSVTSRTSDARGDRRRARGAVRAREEGLIGAIGITGHGMKAPAVHLEALRRFPFDTVLTPWNYRLSIESRTGAIWRRSRKRSGRRMPA